MPASFSLLARISQKNAKREMSTSIVSTGTAHGGLVAGDWVEVLSAATEASNATLSSTDVVAAQQTRMPR